MQQRKNNEKCMYTAYFHAQLAKMSQVTKLVTSQKVATKRLVRTSPAWMTTNLLNDNSIITNFPYAAREKPTKMHLHCLFPGTTHRNAPNYKTYTFSIGCNETPRSNFSDLDDDATIRNASHMQQEKTTKNAFTLLISMHNSQKCAKLQNSQLLKRLKQKACSNISGLDDDDPVQ